MVVQLDRLASYQGSALQEWLYGGSSGSSWKVITKKTERRRRKMKPITDVTNTALGKEEIVVRL
jgi:hypothetical protein